MWGYAAEGYHATNLVLHLLNAVLVFFLTREFQSRYRQSFSQEKALPLFTATLFLCYASHSEPIFWIVARGGSLCTLFLQTSLLLFFRERLIAYLLALVCFVIALFTYELSWIFPLILTTIFLFERMVLKKEGNGKIVFVYWSVLLAYLLYRFVWLHYPLPYGTAAELTGDFFGPIKNFSALMARLFVPPVQSSGLFIAFVLLAATTIFLLFYQVWKKSRQNFFGLFLLGLCSIIAILPVVSLGIDTHDSESERFIYFASVFACLFLGFLLSSLIRQKQWFCIIFATLISLNLYSLYRSSQTYRYASDVSGELVQTLNGFPDVKAVNFINLPTQYKGALLFRIGFVVNKSGILHTKYDSINVISYQELKEPAPFVIIDKYRGTKKKNLTVEFAGNTMLFY